MGALQEYYMLADIGLIALFLAFLFALYGSFASGFGGWKERHSLLLSGRNAALITFPLLTLSVVILVYSLIKLDFSLAYVADVSSESMSPFLRITALWGGQAGSVLFWGWMMAGFVVAVIIQKWNRDRELLPFVIMVAMGTTAFFIGLSVFITNPFARLWHVPGANELTTAVFQPLNAMAYIPEDGQGLNPLLRHFGMIGHPPTTYLGFTGFVIPYAFAMAALIKGKAREDEWIRTTRGWTLIAWLFLTIGLVLGGRWAYDVLGWGGFWGWDPIENAMLLPWLTATAFLHSVMMQEKRGMLKIWNMILIILTYSLILFGTFITRTGVVSSVHAFAQSALGPVFFAFIGFTFLASMSLVFRNLRDLKTEQEIESIFSRESAFLLQNLLFLAITFAVLWGTIFPMISELVTGTKITVGPPFYKKVNGPLFSVLMLLMAVTPFFAWRRQNITKLAENLLWPFVGSLDCWSKKMKKLGIGIALFFLLFPIKSIHPWMRESPLRVRSVITTKKA
jgi:cytochrome c-type biogenesis protein CcmF